MRKLKCFMDYDKEEKWLNDMAKKGYKLEDVGFGYKFTFAKVENNTIRIDNRVFKNKGDFIDYCTLFEDSGWKHIVGSRSSGAQYFEKVDENSEDDIFSDSISKAGKYKRVANRWIALAVCYLMLTLSFISNGQINVKSILNPKLLYYTPGLWERTGVPFWRGFLFETPFAILRAFIWLIPIMMVIYVWVVIKSTILYYKEKNLK